MNLLIRFLVLFFAFIELEGTLKYDLVDLNTIVSEWTLQPTSMNDYNEIVGKAIHRRNGEEIGFYLNVPKKEFKAIPPKEFFLSFDEEEMQILQLTKINNLGTILGSYDDRPFTWTEKDGLVWAPMEEEVGQITALNNLDEMLGFSIIPDNFISGLPFLVSFTVTREGEIFPLIIDTDRENLIPFPLYMNDSKDIVYLLVDEASGEEDEELGRAYGFGLLRNGELFTQYGTDKINEQIVPLSINNSADVLFYQLINKTKVESKVLKPDGTEYTVPSLQANKNALIVSLNDSEEAVGSIIDHLNLNQSTEPEPLTAIYWSPKTGTLDLNKLIGKPSTRNKRLKLKNAICINNKGTILVEGEKNGIPFNGILIRK